jgi:nucleotide-binding universal stress UspA family protein
MLVSNEDSERPSNPYPKGWKINRILVAIDFGDATTRVLETALAIASQSHAELFLVHAASVRPCCEDAACSAKGLIGTALTEGRRRFQELHVEFPSLDQLTHHEFVCMEPPTDLVQRLVRSEKIDLVVAGSHGAGRLERLARGSVAEAILRQADCPTLIVGPRIKHVDDPFHHLLLATNLERGSETASRYAAAIAMQSRGELDSVHVLSQLPTLARDPSPALQELRARHLMRCNLPGEITAACSLRLQVKHGDPGLVIPEVAEESGVGAIVTGISEGLLHDDHSPWSTFADIVRNAPCPVLAVRSQLSNRF